MFTLEVYRIFVNSYLLLEHLEPTKVYKYAETGFETAVVLKLIKTHQPWVYPLIMTPVINKR